MMRKLLILLSTLICSVVYAQNEARLYNTISKLKAEGVDTFIVYHSFVSGGGIYRSSTACTIDDNSIFYLYYIAKGNTSVIRVDNCYEYSPIVNLDSPFIKQFSANLKKVDKELIRPLTYIEPGAEKKKKRSRRNIFKSHSPFEMIEYITPLDTVKQVYDLYDLEPMYNADLPNESYKYNNNTWTVKLAAMGAKETQGLTFMLKEKP